MTDSQFPNDGSRASFLERLSVTGQTSWARQVVALFLGIQLIVGAGTGEASTDRHPLEPPDTSSPRATVDSFLGSMEEARTTFDQFMKAYRQERGLYPSDSLAKQWDQMVDSIRRAARCLDLSQVPSELHQKTAVETTLLLKEIFDRIKLPPLKSIPDVTAIQKTNLTRWRLPNTEITIAKVQQGPRAGEFLFTPDTIARTVEFYEKVRHMPYGSQAWVGLYDRYTSFGGKGVPLKLIDRLPQWAKKKVLGQAVWRWVGLTLPLIMIVGVLTWIARLVRWQPNENPLRRNFFRLALPVSIIVFTYLVRLLIDRINFTGDAHQAMASLLTVLFYLAGAWGVILLGNMIGESVVASPRIRAQSVDAAIVRLTVRVLAVSVSVILVIHGARSVGVPIGPLLAGLGIGGLALALAAQPTIENFIAALMLFADRPVRIGDFCRFGDKIGTVEEIGVRSTRFRTLEHTLLTVPNADFAKQQIENFSLREKIWYHPTIRLRLETTPEQARYVLDEVRKLLLSHPKVLPDPARIRFQEFGTYSLNLEVFAYVNVTDYDEFLKIVEELNLLILDVVHRAGTGLAAPVWRT